MAHLTQELRQHLLEAATVAYHDMFVLMAAIVLLAAVPVLGLRTRRSSEKITA
ncbi:hypothetical protein [Candidatus Entotheonella palauensis]|uniref:hypothetical protein n=1 Tax=Candidatus Entotheonella palauensis TaxID=93172 RepID=UPI0015C4BDD3|nr:hypothetical protein [Candidatus Entotheonella palauensis]